MAEIDLGEFDQPVLIFGGCYSNLAATETLRWRAAELGIPADRVICSGDVVAYCGEPENTVTLVREWGVPVLQGNCEESLGQGMDDCGCGFNKDSQCDLLSVQWYRYATEQLSKESCDWMTKLPTRIRFNMAGRACVMVHGSVLSMNEFVFASTLGKTKLNQITEAEADIVIAGHSGIPFGQILGDSGSAWLNSGVVGMPANDGTPDGWYMLMRPEDGRIRVSWHRLKYPYQQTQQSMLAAGLDSPYVAALEKGIWPSDDILPEAEKASTGSRLLPAELVI